jgi:predicted aldo/keto reductase-like oxidoreductase
LPSGTAAASAGSRKVARGAGPPGKTSVDVCAHRGIVGAESLVCARQRPPQFPLRPYRGWHIGLNEVDERLSIRIIRTAADRGINFMDNCWDYNEGVSEIRMGKALRDDYRDRVFLMTKIDGRSRKEAGRQLDESLRRLQVDMINLVQHHEVLRYEDPHRIFDDEGANAALVEAREAGRSL